MVLTAVARGRMFGTPYGRALSAEQVQELDDEFFSSCPDEYFYARIRSIAGSGSERNDTDLAARVAARLGLNTLDEAAHLSDEAYGLRVAVDAFSVRHHVAEALVRLYHSLAIAVPNAAKPASVWATIVDGPRTTKELVDQSREFLFSDDGRTTFPNLILPPVLESDAVAAATRGLNVVVTWLIRAMNLLTRTDIEINSAHNKVKHGLVVRSRNDLRLTFSTTGPDENGVVPLDALTGPDAVDLLDDVVLDYLSRPPKDEHGKNGLEQSSMRLDTDVLLTEAWLLTSAHSALFGVAASRHHESRGTSATEAPTLPVGPTPQELLGNSVIGLRSPLTLRPDGGDPRSAGIAFQDGFVPFTVGGRSSGVVGEAREG